MGLQILKMGESIDWVMDWSLSNNEKWYNNYEPVKKELNKFLFPTFQKTPMIIMKT